MPKMQIPILEQTTQKRGIKNAKIKNKPNPKPTPKTKNNPTNRNTKY
jgi:hypothetical protein